jgi:SAM-dependent methyltransferase
MNWLTATRDSYDTVAASYADLLRGAVDRQPLPRGVLALFADLVRDTGGPVADLGCGPGRLTAHLRDRGVEAFGVDLSPAMIDIARREHPDLRFDVGSMTDLDLPDVSVGGVLAWFSLIHVPDDEVPTVLAHVHRVLRPGGVALFGFFVGDRQHTKTEGYGGHPMSVQVHWRPLPRVAGWLRDAGLSVEAEIVMDPGAEVPGGVLIARRASDDLRQPQDTR